MRGGWVALVVGVSLAGAALARAPDTSPFPRPRPGGTAAVAPISIADAVVIEALRTPAPPPRPALAPEPPPAALESAAPESAAPPSAASEAVATLREAPATSLLPRRRPAGLSAPVRAAAPVRAVASAPAAPAANDERGLCGVRGLTGQRLPRITSPTQGCGIDEPVRISAVQGIALSPAATVNCDTARAFDRWVREAMLPAIGNRGGGVDQIVIGSHYACRPRNNQRGARISEHGRGNAIDVMSFRLADGERVTVEDDFRRGRHRRAMQRMYEDACGIFRTTLGPDSDRFHQNHFHFDLARHRNGGTYCR